VIARDDAKYTARNVHACQKSSVHAGINSSAAMTRRRKRSLPNAFIFRMFIS
jgi:hypothetical protein